MRTGASCVAKYGGLTSECNSAEVRYVVGQENSFKYWVRKCKEHGIYLIANIDQYKDRDFHYPLSLQRLQDMIDIMIDEGFDKRTARITVDNEPMKYISVAEYISNVNSVIKYVGGD